MTRPSTTSCSARRERATCLFEGMSGFFHVGFEEDRLDSLGGRDPRRYDVQ